MTLGNSSDNDFHILLSLNTEDDIINLCTIDKRFRSICNHNKQRISKHIMKNIYGIDKPSNFREYYTFYKHFKKSRKTLPYLMGLDDNPSSTEIKRVYTYWYTDVVNPRLVQLGKVI